MAAKWDQLTTEQKIDQLHNELGALIEHGEANRQARDELRKVILDRLSAIEKAVSEMESRVAKLEGKNDI